jgi:hypothetical protein
LLFPSILRAATGAGMLQGKDLLGPPFNLTRNDLFALVRSGRLVPYRKYNSLYPDPTEPPGCERILPRYEQRQIYDKLRWARYQRKWIQDWLTKSPEERQAEPVSSPPSDQEYVGRLRQYEIEIPGYENKLDPSQVWQGEFGPRYQEEIFDSLEAAWYLDKDIQNCPTPERKPMLMDQILLEPEQVELLCKFVEAERSLPKHPRGKFLAVAEEVKGVKGTLFLYTEGHARLVGSLTDAEILAENRLLTLSEDSSGSMYFHIRPEAFQYYRELKNILQPAETVEKEIRGYLFSDDFRRRFPNAFLKWSQAESLLWESESEKQFTTIGHLCREALQEFADVLVNQYSPPGTDPDKAKTVSRIRAVLQMRARRLGSSERLFLEQLLGYWGTVSDLVQRQEHGAQKDGTVLAWEDARRVVFQTMIVMYEIHRCLT